MDRRFLLKNYCKRGRLEGFTLIELLVVVVILGILAAIAAPELLKQVEKGRQVEAKSNLGTINRAQQAYRIENATFGRLAFLPLRISGTKYYTIDDDTDSYPTPDSFGSAQRARALPTYDNDIRNYASAVGQTASGVYTGIICEADSPNNDTITTANSAGSVECVNGAPQTN